VLATSLLFVTDTPKVMCSLYDTEKINCCIVMCSFSDTNTPNVMLCYVYGFRHKDTERYVMLCVRFPTLRHRTMRSAGPGHSLAILTNDFTDLSFLNFPFFTRPFTE